LRRQQIFPAVDEARKVEMMMMMLLFVQSVVLSSEHHELFSVVSDWPSSLLGHLA
jgi:hypothetical protein